MNTVPCKGCKERHIGCHTECLSYKEWKEERTRMIEKDFAKREAEQWSYRRLMDTYLALKRGR